MKRTNGSAPDAPPIGSTNCRPPPPLLLHPPLRRRWYRHRRFPPQWRSETGRPAKEGVVVGKRTESVMTTPVRTPDRDAKRKDAQRFSTASKRRRPNPTKGKAHEYPKVRLDCGLDPNRFILIKNLNRHPAWDFKEKKIGGGGQQRHRCQVCRAIGMKWHGKYRGGSAQPARVKIMCGCEQCPVGFCSMACFNMWHYGEEMPPIED